MGPCCKTIIWEETVPYVRNSLSQSMDKNEGKNVYGVSFKKTSRTRTMSAEEGEGTAESA